MLRYGNVELYFRTYVIKAHSFLYYQRAPGSNVDFFPVDGADEFGGANVVGNALRFNNFEYGTIRPSQEPQRSGFNTFSLNSNKNNIILRPDVLNHPLLTA